MKTRRRRKALRAGNKLGEGIVGIVYETGCSVEGESFCKLLNKITFDKVELYGLNGQIKVVSSDVFKSALENNDTSVSKIIKNTGTFISTTKETFLNEVRENRDIALKFGKRSSKEYLTTTGIDVDGFATIGAIIGSTTPVYVVFNELCNPDYPMNIKHFVNDILLSMTKNPKNHNDIKLDNIVMCPKRYKLIDWGKAADKDQIIIGNSAGTSPIRNYIRGFPAIVSVNLFARKINARIRNSLAFREVYNRVISETKAELATSPTRKQLMNKYRDTFDVFMFGMTVLYAVIKYELDYSKYAELIRALTSLENPLNADEALAFSKKFLKKV
jgi:serine/threonine protein kinase